MPNLLYEVRRQRSSSQIWEWRGKNVKQPLRMTAFPSSMPKSKPPGAHLNPTLFSPCPLQTVRVVLSVNPRFRMGPRVSFASAGPTFFLQNSHCSHLYPHISHRQESRLCPVCPLPTAQHIRLFLFAHYTPGMFTFFLNLRKFASSSSFVPEWSSFLFSYG